MKSAIVTGAAGFLGSHLCKKLADSGFHVVGVDNLSTGSLRNVEYLKKVIPADRFMFFTADVTHPWDWVPSLSKEFLFSLKNIFHFASPASPLHYQKLAIETIHANTRGLENAINFADQYGARVVFASTSEVYGDTKISPQVESNWGHVNSFGERSCYNEAKRCGEAIVFSYNKRNETRHGLVRIFNTYGPRMNPDDGRVVINFLIQALHGKKLTVYGNGKQTRSFCYVDDLVEGIVTYSQTSITTPINIGNPFEFTILQLAQIVQNMFSEKSLEIVFEELPSDDPQQRRPDISAALKSLHPWEPKIQLEDGLKKMADWMATEL